MSNLERRSGVALWRQIAQTLEAEIDAGKLSAGDRLPTEPDLAARFGVNRHTVRRAVAALQEDGFVSIEQGRGTFVTTPEPAGLLSEGSGREDTGELLSASHTGADARIAGALGLSIGDEVIELDLVHMVAGEPVSISSHYFPATRFRGLETLYAKHHSILEALGTQGVTRLTRSRAQVRAQLPSRADADVLKMPKGQPVVVAESIFVDQLGAPTEFTVSRSAGGRMQLVFET